MAREHLMSRQTIVNPVAEPEAHAEDADRSPPADRQTTLDDLTVALHWNDKQNGLPTQECTRGHLSYLAHMQEHQVRRRVRGTGRHQLLPVRGPIEHAGEISGRRGLYQRRLRFLHFLAHA